MNLEHQEIEAISALKDNFGYKMVCDRIQAEVDTVKSEIFRIGTPVNSEAILYCRALNRILEILLVTPQEMTKELEKIRQEVSFNVPENTNAEFLSELLRAYEMKKKKVV